MRLGGLGQSAAEASSRHGTPPPIWGSPIRVQRTVTNRYDHEKSVRDTIGILTRQARAHAHHPVVEAALADACRGLSYPSDRQTAGAIFHWIRHHLRFVDDEALMYSQLGVRPEDLDKELLIVPPVLLAMRQPMGDCDDYSLLAASMCLAAGLQPYWITVAADRNEPPSKFSHIYIAVALPDEHSFIVLDAGNRYRGIPPGWETSHCTRKAGWKI
jgi:hypothetical protein